MITKLGCLFLRKFLKKYIPMYQNKFKCFNAKLFQILNMELREKGTDGGVGIKQNIKYRCKLF